MTQQKHSKKTRQNFQNLSISIFSTGTAKPACAPAPAPPLGQASEPPQAGGAKQKLPRTGTRSATLLSEVLTPFFSRIFSRARNGHGLGIKTIKKGAKKNRKLFPVCCLRVGTVLFSSI
jgi:hypothetical protein